MMSSSSLTSPKTGTPRTTNVTPRTAGGTPRTPISARSKPQHVDPLSGGKPKVTPLRMTGSVSGRSPSMNSNANALLSHRSTSAASVASVASTTMRTTLGEKKIAPTKSTKQLAAEARRKTEKELNKHLQAMLSLKQRLRRSHDEAGKEYSGLHNSLAAATEMLDDLAKMKTVDLGAAATAVMERSRQATAATGGASTLQVLSGDMPDSARTPTSSPRGGGREASPGQESNASSTLPNGRLELDSKRAAAPKLNQHASVLERNRAILNKIIEDGNEVMKQLNLCDRELQHLMLLVDRAADIDMQCMSGAITDTVVVNGSPLYPNLTLQDSEQVIGRAAAQCSKAGRFSTYIRRLMASGMSEVTHSAEQLATAMKTSTKVAQEQVSALQRELEAIIWEERRAKKHYAVLTTEGEKVLERLKYIHKTLRLREAAVGSISIEGLVDPVISALKDEEAGVQAQLDQIEEKLRVSEAAVDKLTTKRRGLRSAIEEAKIDLENRRQHCLSQQTGSVEFSPTRLLAASKNSSPRRAITPGSRGASPRTGARGNTTPTPSRPQFRTY